MVPDSEGPCSGVAPAWSMTPRGIGSILFRQKYFTIPCSLSPAGSACPSTEHASMEVIIDATPVLLLLKPNLLN